MGRATYILPVFLWLFNTTSGLPRVDPLLVETNVGVIRGVPAPDGNYTMFLGIPFATVDPLNPFGPSSPHPGFEGTFEAVDDSVVCPQRDELTNELVGVVDCLRLNVYVPDTANSTNPLAVMVFVHGGSFTIGSAGRPLQGPKYLVRHDVIVVNINYRLGAYGFLCPDIPEVPGNQGIKDQLIALRWIKNNIEAFGGNSNQITLFGESAGAMSIDFHMTYCQENLFNSIILQSGTSLSNYAIKDANPNEPMILAAQLGFVTNNVYEALGFLRTLDPAAVSRATEETFIQSAGCVENVYDNVERYITWHPAGANVTNAASVPVLIGINSNEMGLLYDTILLFEPFIEISDLFDFDNERYEEMLAYTRRFYIGDEDVSAAVRDEIINFSSDITFMYPNYRRINKYFDDGANTIYQYVFSYSGDRNLFKSRLNLTDVWGAVHADELSYLFDVVVFQDTPTPEDQLIIDRMTTLWTNYAKFGDPTPEVTDLLPLQWPTVTKEILYYLDIDSELSIKRRPFYERAAFWDLLFELNQEFVIGAQSQN